MFFWSFGPDDCNTTSITLGLKGKHISLLQPFINYRHKKVLTFGPDCSSIVHMARETCQVQALSLITNIRKLQT
jgi:hypothetical protein